MSAAATLTRRRQAAGKDGGLGHCCGVDRIWRAGTESVMAVRWLDRANRRQLKEFVELEPTLIREDRLFVSEPHVAVVEKLAPSSPFYDEADLGLIVADDGERPVARCAPIINRRWRPRCRGWHR